MHGKTHKNKGGKKKKQEIFLECNDAQFIIPTVSSNLPHHYFHRDIECSSPPGRALQNAGSASAAVCARPKVETESMGGVARSVMTVEGKVSHGRVRELLPRRSIGTGNGERAAKRKTRNQMV
ncbi:hypothetical protein TRVL_00055 [Trypanosoma vivax]|nr:hypothetical protein TRVL_00055 [Trypanosoma vivax]